MSLLLTRRISETICIIAGQELIRVTVHGVNGNQVRIGVEASRHVKILREELMPYDHTAGEGEIT